MLEIADEIKVVSENADKCVNYPIGEKLEKFINHQNASNQTNFPLSGVIIFAAAKIFGRKVDYLEQDIMGIAKNFESLETSDEKTDEKKEKEKKKSRTKKFVIEDRVNIEKIEFEEGPINVLAKVDINKTLATPSRINRLKRMKEFFSNNKSRGGKLAIPKNLLFGDENKESNFGGTQIHDIDDQKEIIGSRRDFRSFSYFINNASGELQSDIDNQSLSNQDNLPSPDSPSSRFNQSPINWETRPTTPNDQRIDMDIGEEGKENSDKDWSSSSINIDEGIEFDESERAQMLLHINPSVKMIDIRVKSPSLFPSELHLNEDFDINSLERSMLTLPYEVTDKITDFDLPSQILEECTSEVKMKNIFLVPLKKLKHKCAFDLPNDEYGEMKRRKRDQHKSTVKDYEPIREMRIFKKFDTLNDDDLPFLGFTLEQQKESLQSIYLSSLKPAFQSKTPQSDIIRKFSNDSGFDFENDFNVSDERNQAELSEITISDCNEAKDDTNNNINGGDSCYQSLASGDSTKPDLCSFFKDFESRNVTIDTSESSNDESLNESREVILQMQQTAVNISKWKEFLKPILAASEARSKIDVHQCGIEIINKIGDVNDSASFKSIAEEGRMPAYFLTMLQLINNRNIDIDCGEQTMMNPTNPNDIKITLRSKVLHRDKFDEMGEQFAQENVKKINNIGKRKAATAQTSTPAKRMSLMSNSSLNFSSINESQNTDNENEQSDSYMLSQGSSGYCSQTSTFSDL
ncbi:CLUMA_CG019011, isoform A [Clunio marinus]|uniref:CLUMA_CG019011, isoform A n=1 Tax=Clunio marinus TaxID=568069 RepID=A0A1J1J2V5_9DIPT|nr:CLUMA_CG019011, isoform A [Clunio marinus]